MTPEDLVLSGALAAVTGAVGVAVTAWRARAATNADATDTKRREALLQEHVKRVEARVDELETERLWLRDLSLGGVRIPPPAGRARKLELGLLTSLLRGFATVEEACITDADGLAHSDGSTQRGDDLAVFGSLVLDAEKRLSGELGGLVEVHLVLGDTSHITARPLRGWAEGFAVVASAVSRPVNPTALNAVMSSVALAGGGRVTLARPRGAPPSPKRAVGNAALLDELAKLAAVDVFFADYRATNGAPTSWVDDRADVTPGAETLRTLDRLAARAGAALRSDEVLRIDLVLAGRVTLTWAASLDAKSRIVVASRGRAVDDVVLSRLFGRAARIAVTNAALSGAEAA